MTTPDPDFDFDVDRAAAALAAALQQPGGGTMVLGALGAVATLSFAPEQPARLLRRRIPAALLVGDWEFAAVDPAGIRLEIRHTVRGVILQTETAGPAEAGRRLAEAVLAAATDAGPDAVLQTQSALYGIAAVGGG